MTCATLEQIAGYALGELAPDEERSFEEHYFECERCERHAAGMARLLAQLRSALPPVLTLERRRELESRRPSLPAVHVRPGERGVLRLGRGAEVGLWVMHGTLAGSTRVDVEARSRGGDVAFSFDDVPFDAERGEVVLACQLHYRALPGSAELHVRVLARGPDGQRPVGEYVLDHEFESL